MIGDGIKSRITIYISLIHCINMKPKDLVWSNFEVLENDNSKEQKAKCLSCNAIISARAPRLKSHILKCGNFESCGPSTPKKRTFSEMMVDSQNSSKGNLYTYLLCLDQNVDKFGSRSGPRMSGLICF